MNRLDRTRQVQVLTALVEGNSINAAVRMTGVAKNTILKLLRDVEMVCQEYHDAYVRKLACRRIQCDEIWAFCYAKERNVETAQAAPSGAGDVWTWTAIDADTKLIVSYLVGRRDAGDASRFMRDVASRLTHRVQLTTDGLRAYLDAVDSAFATNIDYAMLVKQYGAPPPEGAARPYTVISGEPDPEHVSTVMSSGKTSPCGWRCAGSPAEPMRSRKRLRTFMPLCPCISSIIILCGFIRRCGSRQRWKSGSPHGCGRLRIFWNSRIDKIQTEPLPSPTVA